MFNSRINLNSWVFISLFITCNVHKGNLYKLQNFFEIAATGVTEAFVIKFILLKIT